MFSTQHDITYKIFVFEALSVYNLSPYQFVQKFIVQLKSNARLPTLTSHRLEGNTITHYILYSYHTNYQPQSWQTCISCNFYSSFNSDTLLHKYFHLRNRKPPYHQYSKYYTSLALPIRMFLEIPQYFNNQRNVMEYPWACANTIRTSIVFDLPQRTYSTPLNHFLDESYYVIPAYNKIGPFNIGIENGFECLIHSLIRNTLIDTPHSSNTILKLETEVP